MKKNLNFQFLTIGRSSSKLKKVSVLASIFGVLLIMLTGCGDPAPKEVLTYPKPNLTKQGVAYDVEISQKLDDSFIIAKGRIKFTPSCEYFLNVTAYRDVSSEYVFTLSKSANGSTFIQGKEPGSDEFTPWGDYRDPLTPRALIMFYPSLVLNGDEDGYLCTVDKLYNFIKDSQDGSYIWDLDFLKKYTEQTGDSWREMVAGAFDLSDSNKQILKERLNSILIPDYTFSLESFPTVSVTEVDEGYEIVLANLPDLFIEIKLTESRTYQGIKPLEVLDFPGVLQRDLSGLTESQILDQFKTEN